MRYLGWLALLAGGLVAQESAPPSGYRWDFHADLPPPLAITNAGRIIGSDYVVTPGQARTSIFYPGANSSSATDGNSAGVIIGTYSDAAGTHGFLRGTNGVYTPIDYPGGTTTGLIAINDSGVILGTTMLAAVRRYFLRTPAGALQLLDPALYDGAYVDLNSSGVLLGVRSFAFGIGLNQAVSLITPGQPPVPALSCGGTRGGTLRISFSDRTEYAVDCISVGAGFFRTQERYVQYSGGEKLTLFRFSSSNTSYSLASIEGINAARQIVGTGQVLGGPVSTVLLTPCVADAAGTTTIRVPSSGGSGVVRVVTDPGCRPVVPTPEFWISHSQPGAGPGTISYTIAANTSTAPRSGTLQIGRTAIPVQQEGLGSAGCVTALSTAQPAFPAGGGTGVLGISGFTCPWILTGVPDWITIPGGLSGTGYANRDFFIAPNTTAVTRAATLTAGSQQVRITQLGLSDCFALVSKASLTFGAFEGTESGFDVIVNPNCTWQATSPAPWLLLREGYNGPPTSTLTGSGAKSLFLQHAENSQPYPRFATIQVSNQTIAITQSGRGSALSFVPLPPCRIADTRPEGNKPAGFGPPSLAAQATRSISIVASACGIPLNAKAAVLNLTVVPKGPLAFLTAWPTGPARPIASTLNSYRGRVVANAAIVPLGENGAISLFASNETDVVIDVNGYFLSDPAALAFYPVTPCRAADTRPSGGKSGEFGPPAIGTAGGTRSFRLPASGCGIPPHAQAYSLNVTAVPAGYLAYVTAWPAGQPQPFVSTLNSWDGQVMANAAIVPAGANGAISVFATNATDLVLDVNGYFAPAGANGLYYYPVTPCRITDTRLPGGILPGQTARTIAPFLINCGSSPDSKAYALNVTVVPPGPLAYLSVWPTGVPQPLVSTLNSFLGDIVANAALVPAGTNAAIDVFASNTTDFLIDLNGFFLP